jgi:anaerobic magnesium-protoporphyrin IX monomethyl ester cyclase
MKILFYYRGAESFAIEQISSVLKESGHKTELIFDPGFDDTFYFKNRFSNPLAVKKRLLNQSRRFSPDLIAFSSTANLYPYVKEMARLLKKELKVPAIIGGIHSTVITDYVLKEDCFDMACVGEGEYAMLELADRMEQGRDVLSIENLWIKQNGKIIRNPERPLIEDLDSLPFADKDLFYNKGVFHRSLQVTTSRGCPYHCSFCVNSFYLSKYGRSILRRRSPGSMVNELKILKQKFLPEFIDFQDDVFTASLPWLEEFSKKYKKEVGIKFLANVHPDTINKASVSLLKEAGCRLVCMGIQSGSESVRKKLLNRKENNAQIIKAARMLKDAGIYLTTEFIFGLPEETPDEAWESVEFNRRIAPGSTSTFTFYPFPGTELAEFSLQKGLLTKEAIGLINEGAGSYHTSLFLDNPNKYLSLNLSYLMPLLVKMPGLARSEIFRRFCGIKTNLLHKIIGFCCIPLHNPMLFKEKLMNYLRMLKFSYA